MDLSRLTFTLSVNWPGAIHEATLGWTWPTLHGPERVPHELELAGVRSGVRAGDLFELGSEPIRNPVTGAEITPGAVLPQGTIFKHADFGSSVRYRVQPLGIDYPRGTRRSSPSRTTVRRSRRMIWRYPWTTLAQKLPPSGTYSPCSFLRTLM